MSGQYQIRAIDSSDFDKKYMELLHELSPPAISPHRYSRTDFHTTIHNVHTNEFHHIFVIEDLNAHAIVASGTILIEQKCIHEFGRVGHIEDVVVSHSHRRFGLGSKIIRHLLDVAKDNKCYKVTLSAADKNTNFYTSCGFTCKENTMVTYF